MLRCLTGAKFTMTATPLYWSGVTSPDDTGDTSGTWETYQDPITGEIRQRWLPSDSSGNPIPPTDVSTAQTTIPCMARGILNGGVFGRGNSQVFGDMYSNVEYVHMWVPANVKLSKRDRITNIRAANGEVVWTDDEYNNRPTVFNVIGVTPLFDGPFNVHIHNFVELERVTPES